jgi:RNA polymerase sigma-70 factor (ECF subfamily)
VTAVDDLTRLALSAQRGDRAALTALVRQAQPDVWRLCAQVGGRERADDLTQETFIRAWKALPRYEAQASARTWLLAIARNVSIDALRAANRRPRSVPLVEPPPHPDHSAVVAMDELVAGLEPERRVAIYLTQILGLSYDEAAAVCEVPVGTIRSRVWRARQDLLVAMGWARGPAADAATGSTPSRPRRPRR